MASDSKEGNSEIFSLPNSNTLKHQLVAFQSLDDNLRKSLKLCKQLVMKMHCLILCLEGHRLSFGR